MEQLFETLIQYYPLCCIIKTKAADGFASSGHQQPVLLNYFVSAGLNVFFEDNVFKIPSETGSFVCERAKS